MFAKSASCGTRWANRTRNLGRQNLLSAPDDRPSPIAVLRFNVLYYDVFSTLRPSSANAVFRKRIVIDSSKRLRNERVVVGRLNCESKSETGNLAVTVGLFGIGRTGFVTGGVLGVGGVLNFPFKPRRSINGRGSRSRIVFRGSVET